MVPVLRLGGRRLQRSVLATGHNDYGLQNNREHHRNQAPP